MFIFNLLARPEFIMTALNWLTANNPLYKDIQIDCGNIDVQLTGMAHNENYETTLRTNPPPTNHSSTTKVNENKAEPKIICLQVQRYRK